MADSGVSGRLCLVLAPTGSRTYRIFDQLSCPTWHSALFHNDRAGPGMSCNLCCDCLKGRHVCCASFARAARLGWRVDRDQYDICVRDTRAHLCAEEQVGLSSRHGYLVAGQRCIGQHLGITYVGGMSIGDNCFSCAISSNPHDLLEARLVDRRVSTVPASDAALIEVDHCHANMWVVEGDHGCRGAACNPMLISKWPLACCHRRSLFSYQRIPRRHSKFCGQASPG